MPRRIQRFLHGILSLGLAFGPTLGALLVGGTTFVLICWLMSDDRGQYFEAWYKDCQGMLFYCFAAGTAVYFLAALAAQWDRDFVNRRRHLVASVAFVLITLAITALLMTFPHLILVY